MNLYTEHGIYTVENGELLHAVDVNNVASDTWVQVSDLTGLTKKEYKELRLSILKSFNFDINDMEYL